MAWFSCPAKDDAFEVTRAVAVKPGHRLAA
jgi:hypothetical protein